MNVKQKEDFLVLLDGTAYLYRAYHALPPLKNEKGENTGAIHGFLKAFNKILEDYNPKYVGLVFDARGKNFRHEIYKEYKANRSPMPAELSEQIPVLYEILKLLGYPPIIIKGVEADDVIGTLSRKFNKINNIKIFSGDKDFAQLVNKKVMLVNPISLDEMNSIGVKKKYDIDPSQIIDYLALMGDKADNIPGVSGVGGKTASRLINKYGNIEDIIKNKEIIPGKVGESIKENIEQLKVSKTLATIKTDLDIKLDLEDLIKASVNKEELIKIYKRLEFNSFLKNEFPENYEYIQSKKDSPKIIKNNYNILTERKIF